MDAVILQLNHMSYAECGGKTISIPCGETDNVQVRGDFWLVPRKINGVFMGYNVQGKIGTAPTPDSVAAFGIFDKQTGDNLYGLGTVAQYRTACGGGAALPLATTIPVVVPEIDLCAPLTKGGTDFTTWWGLPAKAGSDEYRAWVIYNNTQPVAALAGGHTDLAAMVTWLNANYAAAGTWSADTGRLKLVRTTAAKIGVTFTVGNYT